MNAVTFQLICGILTLMCYFISSIFFNVAELSTISSHMYENVFEIMIISLTIYFYLIVLLMYIIVNNFNRFLFIWLIVSYILHTISIIVIFYVSLDDYYDAHVILAVIVFSTGVMCMIESTLTKITAFNIIMAVVCFILFAVNFSVIFEYVAFAFILSDKFIKNIYRIIYIN